MVCCKSTVSDVFLYPCAIISLWIKMANTNNNKIVKQHFWFFHISSLSYKLYFISSKFEKLSCSKMPFTIWQTTYIRYLQEWIFTCLRYRQHLSNENVLIYKVIINSVMFENFFFKRCYVVTGHTYLSTATLFTHTTKMNYIISHI